MKAHIATLKKLPKYRWWSQLGSQAIQDIVERIDQGYQRFFHNVQQRQAGQTTQRVGPPTFRKVRHAKSFTLKQAGWTLLGGNRLRIGSTVYKFAKSRDIEGTIKTVTIKRDALGELYVYFSCLVAPQPIARVMTGKSAGFDFGLHDLPHRQRRDRERTRHSRSGTACASLPRPTGRCPQSVWARRTADGHKPIWPASIAVWRIVRQAFHWELAHDLCTQYDTIRLETLNLQGMKALWGRKVSDLGFGTFVDILHHVASKHGTVVQHIDPWFPSTKRCSCVWPGQRLHHACATASGPVQRAGQPIERDLNAAININEEGASSSGGDPVRLAPASVGC